ncbi:MAG: hypothetical protein HQL32_11375 [Planctomycetes bacterium]|nr:hypothetical protein [Planctomycetota bacterium]
MLERVNHILKEKSGQSFKDLHLLEQAITHDSMGRPGHEFERMEFLGDACVEQVIASLLVRNTNFPEGTMSQLRSRLTSKGSLASILKSWSIEEYVKVGRGMDAANLPDTVYADYFESIFGALSLDQGFEVCRLGLEKIFIPLIEEEVQNGCDFSNHKSRLQELAMKKKNELPKYTILSRSGPEHAPQFLIEVTVFGKKFQARGPSIKKTELNAANEALKALRGHD